MPETKPMGRPLKINPTLVNAICRAAQDEILPVAQIYERLDIFRQTFDFWMIEGREQRGQPIDDLSPRSILCVELVERLDSIYAAHARKLREGLQNPEIATAARLVMCLKPDYAFVEAAAL